MRIFSHRHGYEIAYDGLTVQVRAATGAYLDARSFWKNKAFGIHHIHQK
ncbi:MAG: hypothetical protein ACP5ER_06420 [Candidatus Bathyarchaeales archaeon]